MKKYTNKLLSLLLVGLMLFSIHMNAFAEETQNADDDNVVIEESDKPYLALGGDLTADEQATVLALMGIDGASLDDYDVNYVTNDEEHKYLDEYISFSKIGIKSLSSVVITEADKGAGISISTYNISYCTVGMYKNALATAGVEDANIIVAGPKPISGTAALVGIFKAYEDMTGDEIPEENVDAALNELVVTGELEDLEGVSADDAEQLVAYLKQQITEQGLDDPDSIRQAVLDACDKFGITLSDEDIDKLVDLLQKINGLDLDIDSLINQAKSVYDKLDSEGIIDKISSVFSGFVEWLKGLFS